MSIKEDMNFSDSSGISLSAKHEALDGFIPCGSFKVICRALDGSIRWEEEAPNLVVNVGKNDLLNQYFRGSSYSALFYVGLKVALGSITAADTMSSKAWTEVSSATYSNATRPQYVVVAPTSQSVTNSASPAVFNFVATANVAGCFITTNNTKGGTTGTLFSVVDFASVRSVLNTDTLTATYTISC